MKEELTTKMHSEIQISERDALKFRAFSVLSLVNGNLQYIIKKYLTGYQVTYQEIHRHKNEWDELHKD